MTYPTIPVEVQHRRWLATAAHHEKMARLFDSVGRAKDAAAARRAAAECRQSAEDVK